MKGIDMLCFHCKGGGAVKREMNVNPNQNRVLFEAHLI